MKTIDKILTWLIVAALVGLITTKVIQNQRQKSSAKALPTLNVTDIQDDFPEASFIVILDTSYFQINDARGNVLGSVLLSEPYSNDIKGYNGRTPLRISMDNDSRITNVIIMDNNETPGFLSRVEKSGFFDSWNGLTAEEALAKDVDAVSGATYSSNGIQRSLKARLAVVARQEESISSKANKDWWKGVIVLMVVAMALVCFFIPGKTKTLRLVTLLLSIAIIGFWRNALLSLTLFYSWLTSGFSLATQWVLIIMALLAIVLPLFTGKAFYCTYLCPMGALQELAGKCCRKKVNMSKTLVTILLIVRKLFLLTILILLTFGVIMDLAAFEPFGAFSIQNVWIVSIVFAVVILVISLFIPRPWCRFLCPTGLLLDLVRKIRK